MVKPRLHTVLLLWLVAVGMAIFLALVFLTRGSPNSKLVSLSLVRSIGVLRQPPTPLPAGVVQTAAAAGFSAKDARFATVFRGFRYYVAPGIGTQRRELCLVEAQPGGHVFSTICFTPFATLPGQSGQALFATLLGQSGQALFVSYSRDRKFVTLVGIAKDGYRQVSTPGAVAPIVNNVFVLDRVPAPLRLTLSGPTGRGFIAAPTPDQ